MVLSIENKGVRMENIVVPEPNTIDGVYEIIRYIDEYMGIDVKVWLEQYVDNIKNEMYKLQQQNNYEDGYSDAIEAAIDALRNL